MVYMVHMTTSVANAATNYRRCPTRRPGRRRRRRYSFHDAPCRQVIDASSVTFTRHVVIDLKNLTSLHCFTAVLAAWRSGIVVGRINEVTLRRARLVPGWVTVFRRVCALSACNQPTRSAQPCVLPGLLNRVPPLAKPEMSPVPGNR